MPNTTNFNFPTPADTDLVKDGAAAIRSLGNSIDTAFVDLKGGTTGQILSKASNTDLDYTWIANDQGDITEVQAGTGISVASGTGPVPVVTNTVATTFDAKADLVVGTGADTFAKLTVGANDTILTADSSTATGLKWAAPAASGAFTELASGTLSGASLDLQSISGTYRHLQLILRNYDPASSNSQLRVRFNNDSTANRYVSYDIAGSAGSAYNADYIDLVGYQIDTPNDGLVIIDVPDYANATTWKTLNSYSMSNNAGTPANLNFYQRNGFYNQTAAITRVTVFPNTGNFAGGTYSLYGVK